MKKVLTYSLMLCAALAFSQEKKPEKDTNLPLGNKQYDKKEYADAEANYRISNSKDGTKAVATYNLGNAIYRQKKPAEALWAYSKAVEVAKDKPQKHLAYHNMGNALMEQKNYQGAVEAYKNALRNNPADDQTRYNFALAKKMLKDNPPPPPKKDDKKDKDKDKDKDKKDDKNQKPEDKKGDNKDKDKDKDKGDQKDNKDKGDQKDKNDGKDKKDQGEPKPQPASPSKQRMENMLDAMNNEEKKVQDKLNAKKVQGQPQKQEKDW